MTLTPGERLVVSPAVGVALLILDLHLDRDVVLGVGGIGDRHHSAEREQSEQQTRQQARLLMLPHGRPNHRAALYVAAASTSSVRKLDPSA